MGRLIFVYLFLREYGILIVIMAITRIVLFRTINGMTLVLVRIILIIRRCFPRVRYDSLIGIM